MSLCVCFCIRVHIPLRARFTPRFQIRSPSIRNNRGSILEGLAQALLRCPIPRRERGFTEQPSPNPKIRTGVRLPLSGILRLPFLIFNRGIFECFILSITIQSLESSNFISFLNSLRKFFIFFFSLTSCLYSLGPMSSHSFMYSGFLM